MKFHVDFLNANMCTVMDATENEFTRLCCVAFPGRQEQMPIRPRQDTNGQA